MRRDWRQQDAITEVARGNVVAGSRGRAENRKSVGRSRSEPGPVFQNLRITELGHAFECCAVQALNRRRIGTLVESGLFDGCAHEDTTIAARDQVYLRSANHMPE